MIDLRFFKSKKTFFLNSSLLFLCFGFYSSTVLASTNYDINDIAGFLGTPVSEIESSYHDECDVGNILEFYACEEAVKYVNKNLDIDLSVANGTIIVEKKLPTQKLSSKSSFVDGEVKLTLASGNLTIHPKDADFSDVDYPYIGKVPVVLSAWGDGTVRRTVWNLLVKIRTDTDVDISGSVEFILKIGFTLNPRMVHMDGVPVVILEPAIRLIPDKDSYKDNIEVDVDTKWYNSVLGIALGGIDAGFSIITNPFNAANELYAYMGWVVIDLAIIADDITGGVLVNSFNDALADHDLDKQTGRVFHKIESELNLIVLNSLGADKKGLVYIKVPESTGRGAAVLTAINSIILM